MFLVSTKVLNQKKLNQPIENWKEEVKNDFEVIAFETYSQLQRMKDKLYADGAIYASMSGSGSVLYGVFIKSAPKQINSN